MMFNTSSVNLSYLIEFINKIFGDSGTQTHPLSFTYVDVGNVGNMSFDEFSTKVTYTFKNRSMCVQVSYSYALKNQINF